MATRDVYCVCGQPYDETRFMIQCDACREWFHGSCVGVWEYVSVDLDKYHCPQCEITYGPSLFKKQNNWHRHNYTDMDADSKPVQTGTPVFIKELKSRHFPSADSLIVRLRGQQLTLPHLHQNGFDHPIMIEDKEGLEMVVPSPDFTVTDVGNLVGLDREVDVIDVARQSDIRMRLCEFVNYFNNPNRVRVLNLISLEFSNTKLAELVEAPYIARKLDWVNTVWPQKTSENENVMYNKPEVQKYCLIGVKDSYTDFHVDFGGSSVWYHVLKGEKIFYLIKPTLANLSLYQRWMTSSSQHETFFGDQVDCCYKCSLQAGNTMMIPTGWIHAVLTPVDSLVFGGNFLHSLNIQMQLQIYEIEKKIRTPERFRFPAFETINWYAAKRLCEELKDINDEGNKVPAYLLQGTKALLFTLKQWSQDRDGNKSRREEIPEAIQASKLLKDLSKEIRHAERYLNSLNPPKPERESKRKKRKPVNKDFVDYSSPQSSVLEEKVKAEPKEPLKLNMKVLSEKYCAGKREDSKSVKQSSTPYKVQIKMEPNEPLKLSMKVLNKKIQPKEEKPFEETGSAVSRPPLKLTLPKPVTYPYPSSPLTLKTDKDTDPHGGHKELSDKSWFISLDNSPHVKMKQDGEKGLKVKLAKQPSDALSYGATDMSFTSVMPSGTDSSPHLRASLMNPLQNTYQKPVGGSIYDFHDDSDNNIDDDDNENCLTIDESPEKRSSSSRGSSSDQYSSALRVKLTAAHNQPQLNLNSVLMNLKLVSKGGGETAMKVDGVTQIPKNGIEELLKASCYTRDESPRIEELESGRTSPSTREAIAGMLSISRVYMGDNTVGGLNPADASVPRTKRKRPPPPPVDDFEDNMDKVHQDDDFIYPSLDLSDDEEAERGGRGSKRKVDEAWNPKARVGHVAPKTDRPCREGARKQSVEKGLEAAAAKRASLPPPKRPYHRKKPKLSHHESFSQPSSSSSNPALKPAVDSKVRKPKKGMATAKQRLGKILKIHKMIH